MIIDFHTHIAHESMIAPSMMEQLIQEHLCILDYTGLAPPPEVYEQTKAMRGSMSKDDIVNMHLQMKQAAGIDMTVTFHVDMQLTPEQDASIDSYIDIKLAGGGFGNEVLRSDGSGGESKDFTNLRGATTNVQMTDARITVDGGMSTGTEYRTQTVLSCIVTH